MHTPPSSLKSIMRHLSSASEEATMLEALKLIPFKINLSGIKKITLPISEDEIQNTLFNLRARQAIWQPTPNPLEQGHQATIDFSGFMNGELLQEGQAQDYKVVIGSHMLMPNFEENLIGAKKGETRVLNLVFPEDYFDQAVAGKDVQFKVLIKEVSEPILPELTENFIREIGSISTGKYEDLIDKIKINLNSHHEEAANDQFKKTIFNKLLNDNPFPIPPKLLEEEAKRLREEQFHLLEVNTNAESRTATLLKQAEWNVRVSLLVAILLEKYKIISDPTREKDKLQALARFYKEPELFLQKFSSRQENLETIKLLVLEDLLIEKLMKLNTTQK